jgi:carbon-monoxide dehydrogenase medium subunit
MARLDVPGSLDEALRLLALPGARPMGGGVAVLLRERLGEHPGEHYVALGRIPALRAIDVDRATGELVVGGAATLADVAASPIVRVRAPLLHAAAAAAACPGIRSVATIGGNLVDAPGESDLVAALIALDATLVVRGPARARQVEVARLAAAEATPVATGELLAAIRVPPASRSGWSFRRIQTQGGGDRSAITVAVTLQAIHGRVTGASAAATAIAARPLVLAELVATLRGQTVAELRSGQLAESVAAAARAAADRAANTELSFDNDLRASAAYRRHVLGVLAARAVAEAANRIG